MRKTYNEKWFNDRTIAKSGPNDFGIAAIVDKKDAGIISFSFDLTFGEVFDVEFSTEESANIVNWLWEGTTEELFFAATNNTDLMFPDRQICKEDSDYLEMSGLYKNIRKYLDKLERKNKKKTNNQQISSGVWDILVNPEEES